MNMWLTVLFRKGTESSSYSDLLTEDVASQAQFVTVTELRCTEATNGWRYSRSRLCLCHRFHSFFSALLSGWQTDGHFMGVCSKQAAKQPGNLLMFEWFIRSECNVWISREYTEYFHSKFIMSAIPAWYNTVSCSSRWTSKRITGEARRHNVKTSMDLNCLLVINFLPHLRHIISYIEKHWP